jgi:DNA-binding MarR family transcriptional regulator
MYLDVKKIEGENTNMAEQDHVDHFIATIGDTMPGLDLEVEAIVDRMNGLSRRIRKMLDDTLAEVGLSRGEWHLLGKLFRSGRTSPGELGKTLELSSGAMTNRLDRLEERGLVRRLPDPVDRRSVQVELTDAGRDAYQRSVAVQAERESLVAATLTREEQRRLNVLLRKLMLAFERDPRYGKA